MSPRRTRSSTSARSGIDSRPLSAAQLLMFLASSPATWSAIKATSGEMTTVSAPVLSKRESAGIW